MSKYLADLLANDHPLFTYNIQQMEQAAGSDGIDTRLIADITEKAHAVLRSLGLDPADSHATEVYAALNAAVGNEQFEKLLADTSYVLVRLDDDVVSLCRRDIIENAHHQLPFTERKVDHAQRHLRAEIIRRYAEHDRTSHEMIHNLAEQAGLMPEADAHYQDVDKYLVSSADQATPEQGAASILMIGDIFTDAFIKLNENYAVVEKDADGKEWLKLPFGSKPPYERADIVSSVGPSPNSAISCARLGLDVQLMAWLGDDEPGRVSLEHLKGENVDVAPMVTQQGAQSSYWYVLRHGTDRTMLVKSEAYDYTWHAPERTPEWIYLAYIGEDSWNLHEGLLEYLNENPAIKFVFQPATYHFEWGPEKLAGLYARAHIVVMNREEAMQVTGKPHDDLQALAQGLHDLGPSIVAITDGGHGSYLSHDGKLQTIPNYPDPSPPIDRTGAGDAFASTLVAGIALGKPIEEALRWAPVNSASVVQQLGAQAGLLHSDELHDWLEKAPEDYRVSDL